MRLGDEITLGCNEGYRLIGEKTLRCVLVGDKLEWHTGPPFCHPIRCYPPENIPFGSHSGRPFEEFHYGSSVTYTCREGFSLIGSPISTCSTSADGTRGEWSPSPPKCKVVRCRDPEIENGRVTTKPQPFYTYGDRADFECNPGYAMVGSSTCTCGPDHAWIPLFPKCFKAGTPGGGGGGDDNPGPGNGADPETVPPGDNTGPTHNPETPPGDDTESKNITAIVIGCLVALVVVLALVAGLWKYRSYKKTEVPEAPSSPAQFDKLVTKSGLEAKGSQLNKVSSVNL
ncbi:membrane cofactor protein-like [Podarcis lilfordi]|uniref:Membrane cofactor protein-like n=1 Tax=Podarcis lilfordi TaxID=74358 RepID=A0AA35P7D8_9SAUR|nr:membrane cofactor protein-like [Podarcis lilfordi]